MTAIDAAPAVHWYAMRDLTRSNARRPAYMLLNECRMEVFTPMARRIVVRQGRHIAVETPVIHDLLFVHAARKQLDPLVAKTPTLQYRYVPGGYCKPMVVPETDMNRFIRALRAAEAPRYFRPEEVTPAMCGRRVRIVGGALDGFEGALLSMRGSKYRRLLIELPNFLTAAVEVEPEYIEVLK